MHYYQFFNLPLLRFTLLLFIIINQNFMDFLKNRVYLCFIYHNNIFKYYLINFNFFSQITNNNFKNNF